MDKAEQNLELGSSHNNEEVAMANESKEGETSSSCHDVAGTASNPCRKFQDEAQSSGTVSAQDEQRHIFRKAKQLLEPATIYRSVIYLYAERKLLVFFLIHFMTTMVVFTHFALQKFQLEENKTPDGASWYWWKRLVPPVEFGCSHAILFQMALLPLTMSRLSIASLSGSFIDKIVPMNRMLRLHIHFGYTMIFIVFSATLLFFVYTGILCADGEEGFCDKFTTEIAITGYAILACLMIIGVTSYFRYAIPYELFYAIHHLVFVMYFITIAHTFDAKHRRHPGSRSQTFQWFSSTLLFYLCDRAAMHLNHKHRVNVVMATSVSGTGGSKTIILKLRRPDLFRFSPGQYAFLRIKQFDIHWHPFSIASGPDSPDLEFYIEVFDEQSWTGKLWKLLDDRSDRGLESELYVEVMGPCGTALAKIEDYTHALAIGSGTGIVPLLSLFNQHVQQMLKLDPRQRLSDLFERQDKLFQLDIANQARKGSVAREISRIACSTPAYAGQNGDGTRTRAQLPASTKRDELNQTICDGIMAQDGLTEWDAMHRNKDSLRRSTFLATRSIYGVVFLAFMPVLGVTLFALTISWNTIPIDLYDGMIDALKVLTVMFQTIFAIIAIFIWNGHSLLAYVDASLCLVSPFADWGWFRMYDNHGRLDDGHLALFCLLTLYMTARVWAKAVLPRHKSWKRQINQDEATKLDSLKVMWTTRSVSQVSKILPDILVVWDALVKAWGIENALQVCRFSIFITDRDTDACDALKTEIEHTSLYKCGAIQFRRIDLPRIIEDHTLEMIKTQAMSYSMLAFCGSPELASRVQLCKISNDMVTAMTGNGRHQMDFVSENYGGSKTARMEKVTSDKQDSGVVSGHDVTLQKRGSSQPLATRKVSQYALPHHDDDIVKSKMNLLSSQRTGMSMLIDGCDQYSSSQMSTNIATAIAELEQSGESEPDAT